MADWVYGYFHSASSRVHYVMAKLIDGLRGHGQVWDLPGRMISYSMANYRLVAADYAVKFLARVTFSIELDSN